MTTVEAVPRPRAIEASVWVDAAARTLTVRLPDWSAGYDGHLWREAWQALRRAYANGWPRGAPSWISFGDVHSVPVDGGGLAFTWPVGVAGFAELVARPRLYALVTVDVNTCYFVAIKFLHRAG